MRNRALVGRLTFDIEIQIKQIVINSEKLSTNMYFDCDELYIGEKVREIGLTDAEIGTVDRKLERFEPGKIVLDSKNNNFSIVNGKVLDCHGNLVLVENEVGQTLGYSFLFAFTRSEIDLSLHSSETIERDLFSLVKGFVLDQTQTVLYGFAINEPYNGEVESVVKYNVIFNNENNCEVKCCGNIKELVYQKFDWIYIPASYKKNRKRTLYIGEKLDSMNLFLTNWFEIIHISDSNPIYKAIGSTIIDVRDWSMIGITTETEKKLIVPDGVKILKTGSIRENPNFEEMYILETVSRIEASFVQKCLNLNKVIFEDEFTGDLAFNAFENIGYSSASYDKTQGEGRGILVKAKGEYDEFVIDHNTYTNVLAYALTNTKIKKLVVVGSVKLQKNAFAFAEVEELHLVSAGNCDTNIMKASVFKNIDVKSIYRR